MATIADTTVSTSTDWSSGALDVSSVHQVWIVINVSAIDWTGSTTLTISRIDATSTLFPVVSVGLNAGINQAEIGIGCSYNLLLGDHIQFDMTCVEGTSVAATVSVIGK